MASKKKTDPLRSEEVQERALNHVVTYLTFVRTLTSGMRQRWRRWYNIVRLFRLEGLSTYNRVFIPRGWEQVEKIAPRITEHDPAHYPIPSKPSAVPFTEFIAELLSYIWEEKNLRKNTREMVQGSLIYGTDFVKLDFESITRKEVITLTEETGEVDPNTGEPIVQEIEEEVEISRLPVFRSVDIFDIDVDPRFPSIDEAPGVIHTSEHVSYSQLLRDAEALNYFNLDKLKELGAKNETQTFDNSKEQKLQARDIPTGAGMPKSETENDEPGLDLNDLTVREYWGKFSPTGECEDEEEFVITIVNDSTVIRVEKNPFRTEDDTDGVRPFEANVDHAEKGEIYGVGEIEPTESLQIALNKARNQRLDNVDLILNRMWVYDRNAGINPKSLKSIPGNMIAADDINGIKPLDTADVTSSSYADEDRLERDFQRATGNIDGTDQGGSNGFTNTATGEKLRDKDRTSRFQLKIANLEDTLARIGKKMVKMLRATEGESFVMRRRDPSTGDVKFTKIHRNVLGEAVSNMEFRVKAGSTLSDDYTDRRNDAIAQWNMANAAFDKGVITKEQLADVFYNMMTVAFQYEKLLKRKGGGLQQLLAPPEPAPEPVGGATAGQINPNTLTQNGAPPGMTL